MADFDGKVLNDSRTTLVKVGQMEDVNVYLKRYNYKGLVDGLKDVPQEPGATLP